MSSTRTGTHLEYNYRLWHLKRAGIARSRRSQAVTVTLPPARGQFGRHRNYATLGRRQASGPCFLLERLTLTVPPAILVGELIQKGSDRSGRSALESNRLATVS